MLPRRDVTSMLLIALLAVSVALAQTVTGLDAGLLHLAPALVLLLPLVAGRYIGEERLAALATRRRPASRHRVIALRLSRPRAPRASVARGGALLAVGLAQRGPPVAHAVAL